ncbi:MAG: tetratricopeptide repeat protein [Anaerolineae bacterium]|nr:tetratricopeptide repeat protein [Anaerolineae bacterium]
MSHLLETHVPYWLLMQLDQGAISPGRTFPLEAAVLFADVAGFTPLTEAMAQQGPEGVEVLGRTIGGVLGTFVEVVHAHGGDVARFFGDAITAFWPLAPGAGGREEQAAVLSAVAAAQAIQEALQRFSRVDTPVGPMSLAMRVGISLGPVTAMVVGTMEQQRFVLAGPAMVGAAGAEKKAARGHVLLHPSAQRVMSDAVRDGAPPLHLQPLVPLPNVPLERLCPFVHPALIERMGIAQEAFLADFRHGVVPLFVSFAADTAAAIQDYVVQAFDVSGRHGGYLCEVDVAEKGNVLVILFGVPLSQGDNSARAAACALDLARFSATRSIGATSGALFAGIVGSERRRHYTAFGNEMNLACRLMEAGDAAGAWPVVLLSSHMRHQAGGRFAYGEQQELEVRGKSEPVAVIRLLGRVELQSEEAVSWLGRGRLIGRKRELAWLDEQIAGALGGESRLVTLVGEAGVGKSRLVGELLRRWLERGGTAYLGASLASTQYSPYYAWGELLRPFFGLRGDGNDAARLEAVVAAVNPDFVDRLPLLSDVLGLGLPDTDLTRQFDAQLRQQSTQSLLTDLIHHRAACQPLMLVLEDAHWLDPLSWEMGLAIARAIRFQPFLLVLVNRPLGDPHPAAHLAMTDLEHYASLSLSELEPVEAIDLACTRLGVDALPADLTALIQEKTHGHPFFIEEILLALREQGSILVEEGRVVVQTDLRHVPLPDTVQGIVQARIDNLDERTRLTLMVASVIGRTFPFRILRDVHPLAGAETELRAQLDQLRRLDITPLEQVDPDWVYIFKHAITHEVAYGTLLFAQRRQLHAAVAGWYERAYAGQPEGLSAHYSLLAHHYGHTENQAKQAYYLEWLAQQAQARYAADVAVSAYEQLVAILDGWVGADESVHEARAAEMLVLDPGWGREPRPLEGPAPTDASSQIRNARFQALMDLESALGGLGRRAEQQAVLERIERLARQGRRPDWRAIALARKASYQYLTGTSVESAAISQQGLEAARQIHNVPLQVECLIHCSTIHWRMSQYELAHDAIAQALEMVHALGDQQLEAETLSTMALIYSTQNQYQTAQDHHLRAIAIYRATGNLQSVATSLLNLGVIKVGEGDYGAALQHFEQALQLTQRVGNRRLEGAARQIIAEGFKAVGQYERAVTCGEQALEILRAVGDPMRTWHAMHTLADAWFGLGELEKAEGYARQVVVQSQGTGARFVEGFGWHTLGMVLLSTTQIDAARQAFACAAELRQEIGTPGDRAASLAWLGVAHLHLGDVHAALQCTEEGLALAEQVGNSGEYPFQELWWCRYQVLAAAGEEELARRALAQACRLVEEQTERLDDPQLRRSFLENIALNRSAVQAWSGLDRTDHPSGAGRSP